MTLRAWAAGSALLAGLVTAGGAMAHIVGVTSAALARNSLFDTRHVTLLVIGWSLLAPASGMLAAAVAIHRRRAWGYPTAIACGAFLLVEFVLLGSTLGTPQQAVPAYAAAVACLTLWAAAWRRAAAA